MIRIDINDTKQLLESQGTLPEDIAKKILNELDDLRMLQECVESLLNTNFSISIPSSGKGSRVFRYLKDTREILQSYWENRRNENGVD